MARPEVTGRKSAPKLSVKLTALFLGRFRLTKRRRTQSRLTKSRLTQTGLTQRPPRARKSQKIGAESAKRTHRIRGPPSTYAEKDAFSVAEFCQRHGVSVQLFYKFRDQMPATFRVGTRVLISREAAAEWRRERETA